MTQSPSPSNSPPRSSSEPSQNYQCHWLDCTSSFLDPEQLYNHLCNIHIGRKSTNNLCLVCKWKDCGVSCAKRDHITSHLRVHTPLKPHICEICKKSFKRPQDLKKHERIHTEEHHAEHKHSKAVTVADPGYLSRVRGDSFSSKARAKPASPPNPKYLLSRTKSGPDGSHFGIMPLAAPDNHTSTQDSYPGDYSSWEGMRPGENASLGSKRTNDYRINEFVSEVKKRRLTPNYDSRMVERLNHIAYPQQIPVATQPQPHNFNPRQISFDVNTPEELAAVNEFLVTLGRDVAVPGSAQQRHQPTHASSSDHGGPDPYSTQSFFDALSLSQMGLTGMPGLPTADYPSETTYPGASAAQSYPATGYTQAQSFSRSTQPPVQPVQYGTVYPMIAASSGNASFSSSPSDYPSTRGGSPSSYPGHFHHTPPMDNASPHSTASTPSNATPPHVSLSDSVGATFDYLRPTRGHTPVVHLAPSEHTLKMPVRSVVPLKSLPTAPRPAERTLPPVEDRRAEPGPPAKLEALRRTPTKELERPRSLYPLLKGDAKYKLAPLHSDAKESDRPSSSSSPSSAPITLPPLHQMYRSPSPDAEDASMSSHSVRSTPESHHSPLPRLVELEQDMDTEGAEITPEQRRSHVDLIMKLLVSVNEDFKNRHGGPVTDPPSSPRRQSHGKKLLFEDSLQPDVDVDMTVAA